MTLSIKHFVTAAILFSIALVSIAHLTPTANAAIRIVPTITLISPNGGETLTVGETFAITWEATELMRNVSIMLQDEDGQGYWIATYLPDTGSYDWTVDTASLSGKNFKIWLVARDRTNARIPDVSDNFFTITNGNVTEPPVEDPEPTVSPEQPYLDALEEAYPGAKVVKLELDEETGVATFKIRYERTKIEGTITSDFTIVVSN